MRFSAVASTTGLSVKAHDRHKGPVIVNEDRSLDDSQEVKWRNGNMQRSLQNSIVALTLMRNFGRFCRTERPLYPNSNRQSTERRRALARNRTDVRL